MRHLVLLLIVAAAGCTDDSADIDTRQIRAEISVTITESRGEVTAELEHAGTPDAVALSPGDLLVVKTDLEELVMTRTSVSGHYEATLAALDATAVSVSLTRESYDDATFSAPILPPAVIEGPVTASRSDEALVITWTNPSPRASVTAFVDSCADIKIGTSRQKSLQHDDGELSLPMSEVLAEAGQGATCARIQLVRAHPAELEGLLYPGSRMWVDRYQRFDVSLTE